MARLKAFAMTSTPHPLSADPARTQAQQLLGQLRSAFEQALTHAAQACAVGGQLDAQKLDAQQVLCHELALASADLLAAETAVADGNAATPLDARLALAFAADAIGAVHGRLEVAFAELDLDPAALHALAASPALATLRRQTTGAAALAALGEAVVHAQTEIGQVALDEPVAMAQQAFRRFAAEVVAPCAEAIHRENLTVPESLLQPMREMGVFGLSIPEQYGGSAVDGRDDTLLMITVTEALSEASLAAAGSLITRPEILARALMTGGTPEQKQHWLPQLAAGQPLCAIAITEPDYGSDVASLALKGSRTAGG